MTFEYRDEFERKRIAKQIVKLLMDDQFSPMVLDGDWGVGKTEFCYKLINLIRSEQNKEDGVIKNIPRCQCLYIDAFAEDHGDDPLLMLLGNISRFIKSQEENGDASERYQKWKSISGAVAKSIFKIGGNAVIARICKQSLDDIGEELSEAVRNSAKEGLDVLVDMFFQQYEEAKSSIEALKDVLAELAKEERLIIIVDELDRCRPDFSIALLEKIKHVFDVPNVCFLLIANMRQLEASISHVYGNGADIARYIDKFIKIVVSLPIYCHRNMSVAKRYLFELRKSGKIPNLFNHHVFNFIEYLLEKNSHSLRDIEHFARYCSVLDKFKLYDDEWETYEAGQFLEVIAVYCCCFNRSLAKSFNVDSIDIDQIIDLCKLEEQKQKDSTFYSVRNIVEALNPNLDKGIENNERGFTLDKYYILDPKHIRNFKNFRQIFIKSIMNLSFVNF